MAPKPIQTSYEEKNGKRKLTITVDQDAAVKEAKRLAGKASEAIGKFATAGIAKAKEFASKVPSVDLKIKENVTPPVSNQAPKADAPKNSAKKSAPASEKKPSGAKKTSK